MDASQRIKSKIKVYNYEHQKVEKLLVRIISSFNTVKKELSR